MKYQQEAADRSKALIAYFLLVSLAVAIFSDMSFGLWWILVLPGGILAVSVAGGLLALLYHLVARKPAIESLNSLTVMIGQLLIGTVGSYYLLVLTHMWIN